MGEPNRKDRGKTTLVYSSPAFDDPLLNGALGCLLEALPSPGRKASSGNALEGWPLKGRGTWNKDACFNDYCCCSESANLLSAR